MVARELAQSLQKRGKTVRVIDGCNSEEFPDSLYARKKLTVWDVTIRVRQIHPDPVCD